MCWGGGGLVPQLQMWNINLTFFYYYINICVKVWMVEGGFSNMKGGGGVLINSCLPVTLHPSLQIHWRSQIVAMWQLFFFIDQNSYVQSY